MSEYSQQSHHPDDTKHAPLCLIPWFMTKDDFSSNLQVEKPYLANIEDTLQGFLLLQAVDSVITLLCHWHSFML